MFNQWLLLLKTLLIISTFKSAYTWNPQCSPCRCFDQNNKKTSDCSSSVTSFPLTKIPDVRIETETIFLVGQHLQTIPQDAFFNGASNNLKFVDLKNCKVRTVHAKAFRNLEKLSGLDLSHNELSKLDENVFGLNNRLRLLILQNNNFQVFPETIFHNLPELKYLDLSENKLHYIYPNQFQNNVNLERLIIQSNYLTRLDQALITNLRNLNVLYLDNNPWKCDCQTRDLQKLIINRKIEFIDDENYPLCSKPKQWKGKKWLEVKPKDLCSVPTTPIKTVPEGVNFDVECTLEPSNNYLTVDWLLNGQSIDTSNTQKYELSSVQNRYSLRIKDVQFADIGVYKCWTSNLKGSDIQYEETTLNVTQGTKPNLEGLENQNILVKYGERNYHLPCEITGSPAPRVDWLFNGKILTFTESNCQRSKSYDNTLIYSQVSPSCFGNYTCRATNNKGVAEQNFELLVKPQNPPKVEPVDTDIDNNNPVEGSEVSLNCYVTEPVLLKVEWLKNGQVISPNNRYNIRVNQINAGTYNYILTINDISFSEAGNYKCRANSFESPNFPINVKPGVGPSIVDFENGNKISLQPGDNKDVPCQANGSPKPTITWEQPQPDCNQDNNVQGDILQLRNVKCSGRYKCIVTNSKGRTEKEFNLNIVPRTKPILIGLENQNVLVENGERNYQLPCEITGNPAPKIDWLFNGKILTFTESNCQRGKLHDNTLIYAHVGPSCFGNYTCRASNIKGITEQNFELLVKPQNPPKVEPVDTYIDNNNPVEGSSVSLNCYVTESVLLKVEWLQNGKVISPNNRYNIRVNQINARTYNYILTINDISFSEAGNYKCRANSFESPNFPINVKPGVGPTIVDFENGNEISLQPGDNKDVPCQANGSPKPTITWELPQPDCNQDNIVQGDILQLRNVKCSGRYKCIVTNSKGRTEKEFNLNIVPRTKPILSGLENQNILIENGERNYQLPCEITGNPAPKIDWLFNGKILTFTESNCQRGKLHDNTLIYAHVGPSCFGNYTCRASNIKGITEQNFELLVKPQNPPKVEPVDTDIDNNNPVEGSSVSLNCYVTESVLLKVEWLQNGKVISPNNRYNIRVNQINAGTYNYILTINDISFSEAGNYKCRANSFESPNFPINVKPGVGPSIVDFENGNKISLQPGDNKDVPCQANGSPKPTITWELPQPDCNQDNLVQGEILQLRNVKCSGRYKCIVTNSKGRTEKEFNLLVIEPKITSTDIETEYLTTDNTISEYDDIILTCLVEAGETIQPYWEFNNKPISNNYKYKLVKTPTGKNKYYYNLEIKNIAILDKGNYKCRIGSDSKSINVDVKPAKLAIIDFISDPKTKVEEGTKDFKLECRVSGSHPMVLWTSSNENYCKFEQTIEDRGDHKVAILTIKVVHSICKGQYKCKVDNKQASDERDVDLNVVTLQPPPQLVIESPANNEAVENEEVTLKCLIRGAVTSEPRWLFNSNFDPNKYKIVKEQISDTSYWYNLVIKNLKPEDGGNYKCVIGNHEENVIVIVKPSVKPTIEYISNTQTIEAGRKNFRIACKVTGTPKPKTTWVKSGNFDGCQHQITRDVTGNNESIYLTIFEVNPACSGRYTCVATSSKGESKMDVEISVVSIDEPPPIDIETPSIGNEVIENEDITLKCFIKAHTFEPEWIHKGQVIRTNNKYRITKVSVNQTAYWFNLVISDISPQEKGSYKCRVNNFESEILVNVQESKKPVIEEISNPNTVEEGKKDFTLSCKVSGIPKPKVSWSYEGRQINKNQFNCKYSITSKVIDKTEWLYLTITDVEKSCAGKYKCVAENSKGGEENEIDLSVVSVERPKIIEPPREVFENSNVTLQCLIKGSIDSKPAWLYNNKPVDIKRSNKYRIFMIPLNDGISFMFNLEILNISPYERGNYKCKINNLEKEISVQPELSIKPQIVRIPPTDVNIEEGTKQVILPCQSTGHPTPEITWLYENIPINTNQINNCQYRITTEQIGPQQRVNLTIQNASPSCAGRYKCRTTNFKGSNERDVNIRVTSIPPPFVEAIPPTGNQILENGDVTLRCLVPKKYSAEWFIKDQPVIMEPNSRYSIYIQPGNETTNFWYNLVITNLLPSDKGQYKCKINNNLESVINLEIKTPKKPVIEYVPTKETIVSEGTKDFRLACQVSGVPKPQVSWQYEDNSVTSQLAGSKCKQTITSEVNEKSEWIYLTIAEVTSACSGTYKCITKNSAGVDQKEINLLVSSTKQTLQITTSSTSSDGVNREHDDVTLRCLSTGSSKAEWYHNKKPIDFTNVRYTLDRQQFNSMTTWTILTIKNVSLSDKGDYSCKVNKDDQTYYLDIKRGLVPTVEYLTSSKIIVDENTERTVLPCKVTDSLDNSAEWTFNSRPIAESRCADTAVSYEKTRHFEWYNLTITNITSSCSGQYKCTVSNLRNSGNNDINLTVLPFIPPQINVSLPSDNIREQDSVTLKCLVTSGNINGAKWIYRGKVITTDNKYKITKLIINETAYWYNLEIPNVSIQQSGQYKCSTERGEITHTLNVQPGFEPNIDLNSNTEMIVEEGAHNVTIFCKANGSPTPTIKWYHQSKNSIKRGDCRLQSTFETSSNSQLNYLTITNLNPTCSGKYICTASNSKGNTEKIINLTVMPTQKPEITINSTSPDNIIREGDDVTFSCLATGKNNGPTTWSFKSKYGTNNENLKFSTHEVNSLTYRHDVVIKNITLKQAGTYTCRKGGKENIVNIDVQQGVLPTIEQTNSENIVIHTNAKETVLFCKVSGIPRPDVTWLFSDRPIDLSNQIKCKYQLDTSNQWSNLTIQNASPSCAGYYKCVARNFKGRTEKTVTVRVTHPEPPVLTVKTDSTDSDIIKENDKVLLRCLVKGDINTQVDWLHNGQNIRINHKIIKEKKDETSFWYNLQIERITFAQNGKYQCKTPTFQSNPININVQSTTKPTIKLLPQKSKLYVQTGVKDLTLSCIENGVPIPSGTWEFNNIKVDKISECANSCQYKITNVTNGKTERQLKLTLKTVIEACSGKYKCTAENSEGKTEEFVELAVIPPGEPKVTIQEPVIADVNTDVTITCEVTSIDQPEINWKYPVKKANSNKYKEVITKAKDVKNLYYSRLTIANFQASDFGDYTCEGKFGNIQNSKKISLKAKEKFKPEFVNINIFDNFKIVGKDLVLITKVKGYPTPKLQWKCGNKHITPNEKYLFETSYINDDYYWFNQTIKDVNVSDDYHTFTAINEKGFAVRDFSIKYENEKFSVAIYDPQQFVPSLQVPEN